MWKSFVLTSHLSFVAASCYIRSELIDCSGRYPHLNASRTDFPTCQTGDMTFHRTDVELPVHRGDAIVNRR